MRKDPDVFILRFEKWAGKSRTIGKSNWNWEGRPEHRNLTISTAMEHETLKKNNKNDLEALLDVETSFQTLQTMLEHEDVKDTNEFHFSNDSTTSAHFSDYEKEMGDDVNMNEINELFVYKKPSKYTTHTPVHDKTTIPISSKLSEPSYMKLRSIELKLDEDTTTFSSPTKRNQIKVINLYKLDLLYLL
jgi:hypothetical protein